MNTITYWKVLKYRSKWYAVAEFTPSKPECAAYADRVFRECGIDGRTVRKSIMEKQKNFGGIANNFLEVTA